MEIMDSWTKQEKDYFENLPVAEFQEYDRDYFWYYGNRWFLFSRVADWCRRHPGREVRVLDIGCGMMTTQARYFNDQEFPYFYLGLDFSRPLLAAARRKFRRAKSVQADLNFLPLRGEKFNFIIGLGIIHHLPEGSGYLKKIAGRLLPEGEILLQEPNPLVTRIWKGSSPRERPISPEKIKENCREAGLEPVKMVSINSPLIYAGRTWLRRLGIREWVDQLSCFCRVKTWLEWRWQPVSRWFPILRGMNTYYVLRKL